MSSRTASCPCGRLSAVCEGDPVRVSICHCLDCQRRTGSVFGQQARWPVERVRTEGPAAEWVRVGDSGGKATSRFCPTCGATVYYEIDTLPGFVMIPVGAFADPRFPAPTVSVYGTRKHAWVHLPEGIEQLE